MEFTGQYEKLLKFSRVLSPPSPLDPGRPFRVLPSRSVIVFKTPGGCGTET